MGGAQRGNGSWVGPLGHASSPPLLVRRGVAPSFPLSLTCVRERSADWRYFLVWHLVEGAACLAGTPPPGAPLWRLPPRDRARRVRTEGFHPRDPGGFRRP